MGFLSPNGCRAAFPLCSLPPSFHLQAGTSLGPGKAGGAGAWLCISSEQLQPLLLSAQGSFPSSGRTPQVFSTAFSPLGPELSIPQLVKTAISSLKAGKGITALHSLHFLGEFSCFLEIYSTYLSPLLNQFQLPH